jgi:hypothetical protein
MKILKGILLTLVALVALVLIVALFVEKDYAIEREIVINKPKQEVFNYIKFVKNQDHFSKWNQLDPNMKKSYKGTDGQVGFVYSWDSNDDNVGKGEQEIANIVEGEKVEMKLRFKVPFESESEAYLATESVDSPSTKVKWGFKGTSPYPFNIMGLFFDMENLIGGDLATGLSNLKGVLEK